jgi:hypothetical protein
MGQPWRLGFGLRQANCYEIFKVGLEPDLEG